MENIQPSTFAEESFAKVNADCFDAYIDYRLKGIHAHIAFVRLFGADDQSHIKCEMMEHNPYFQREFTRKLAAMKPKEMWTENLAVQKYLEMLNNPFFKDSTRLSALKELNVLLGITEVDDAGRTRRVPTLSDLYATNENRSGS